LKDLAVNCLHIIQEGGKILKTDTFLSTKKKV
jgi:hypothetical protein